jgi:fructose-1,6-bisphosphatase-3
MVSDTDTGAKIRSQIQDLRQLLDAYRNGAIEKRA